ncbi:MAG: amidoligase family protein, partial [Chloroflexota bacterium]
MSAGSGTQEAGEASSSPARAGAVGAGPLVRLPEDSIAVEWWLARRAVEGDGGVPYASDGVLALWPERRAATDRWTFGLEFEFAVADAGWVASELHARGLCASPEPVPCHSERADGLWAVEQDRSVTSVFESPDGSPPIVVGGEVVSPPLRDTPEAWQQVATVLEVLRQCGAEVNRSCGLHVHIGADALREPSHPSHPDADPALRSAHEPARDLLPALSRLAMLASVCFEDLVFRLASAEGGRHRGQAFFYRHCRPLEQPLRPAYDSLADLTGALGRDGAARRAALNLTNVGDPRKDTVEFRQCNATLDGRVVQAFCRLCAALVGAARWQPQVAHLPSAPLGAHWQRGAAAPTVDERAQIETSPQP